jgi:hypothetical protein
MVQDSPQMESWNGHLFYNKQRGGGEDVLPLLPTALRMMDGIGRWQAWTTMDHNNVIHELHAWVQ